MKAPTYDIDPKAFWDDPYPDLARLQSEAPIAFVPQLGSILMTRRDHIAECEKRVEVFSSHQPDGLMNKLMGHNMMRKDGKQHQKERRATFPALSPRTVRSRWLARFRKDAEEILADLRPRGQADLVTDYAMLLSGNALRAITGLETISAQEMDACSQAMIDGIANYAGDPDIEARCNAATAMLDAAIVDRAKDLADAPDSSLISVQLQAGLPMDTVCANVKLAISGGQNEPRDAIAGMAWALLSHPDQLAHVLDGDATWAQAFDEYVRWISPIGMSPRRVAMGYSYDGIEFEPEGRVFFMFGAANRDPAYFDNPDCFDITRDSSKHIAFGSGPHFCAGAAASRTLIADIALPMLFQTLPDLRISETPRIGGWAFRGLLDLKVAWTAKNAGPI
ncbi:MAG: cytochrome P450 [Pseudomonadota bacterium]